MGTKRIRPMSPDDWQPFSIEAGLVFNGTALTGFMRRDQQGGSVLHPIVGDQDFETNLLKTDATVQAIYSGARVLRYTVRMPYWQGPELPSERHYPFLEEGGPPGLLVPEMHFIYPANMWIREHGFGTTTAHPQLRPRIERLKAIIKPQIERFIREYAIDLIIPQNILVKPLQFSLALAITEIIDETGIPTISHNHDFYWERDDWRPNCVKDILDRVHPPDLPSITHVVINTLLQKSLKG